MTELSVCWAVNGVICASSRSNHHENVYYTSNDEFQVSSCSLQESGHAKTNHMDPADQVVTMTSA
eukprot:3937851-Rhodomonas_salina.2